MSSGGLLVARADRAVGSSPNGMIKVVAVLYPNVSVFAHQLRVIDAITVGLSAIAVWAVGVEAQWWPTSTRDPILVFALALVVAFIFVAGRFNVYHARRTEHLRYELYALAEVAGFATGVSCLGTQVLTGGLPGRVYVLTGMMSMTALIGLRLLVRFFLRGLRRQGKDLRWWLVVGRNEYTEQLIREIVTRPSYGIGIAKVVDIQPDRDTPDTGAAPFASSLLDSFENVVVQDERGLRSLLDSQVVDEVVICLPVRSHCDQLERIVTMCSEAGISTMHTPLALESHNSRSGVRHVGAVPMIVHWSGPDDWDRLLVKRVLDLFASGVALIVLSPLIAGVAAAVKLSSPGPVFFKQTRIGFHGRPFRMIKFRTMVAEAPHLQDALRDRNEADGPVFKIKEDPRITPLGKILRKYHLDELPQLWNVLVGDMSIVGPRPLPPKEAFGDEWWQRRRLSMPPGLTCLWQAKGDHRMPFEDWMRLDVEYIDRWSLTLDFRIMIQTIGTLARGTGW